MSEFYFDRLLWLPRDKVDLERIKLEMTITPKSFSGDAEPMPLYELSTTHVGVPRRWGLHALREFHKGEIIDRTTFPHVDWPEFQWPVVDGKKWNYKPGQRNAIDSGLAHFRSGGFEGYGGLLDAPCGSGKTFMAMKTASELQTNALIVTNKNDLAGQWQKTGTLGDTIKGIPPMWPHSKFGHVQQDSLRFIDCQYVTAMVQTLHSRIDRLPEAFWRHFGMLIWDEGHLSSARTLEAVLRKIWARYRYFVSATWRRADELECIWYYHVGPVVARPKVSRLKGEFVQCPWKTNHQDKEFRKGPNIIAPLWVSAIAENNAYNVWIVKQMVESSKVGRRMLVISGRREHCFELRKRFMNSMIEQKLVPNVGVYVGDTADRKTNEFEKSIIKKSQNIIATTGMMKLGTDIPELDTLLLATPEGDVEQIVGRIQRDAENKKPILIIDPVFQTPWNRKQAERRKATYVRLGFTEQRVA